MENHRKTDEMNSNATVRVISSTSGNKSSIVHKIEQFETEVTTKNVEKLFYEINDVPPWYLSIFLGLQHYLTMAGATVSVPFIICPALCMTFDDPGRSYLISTLMFICGIVTLLQSTFGTRLPIIQGGSFSFIIPTLAILQLDRWKCPPGFDTKLSFNYTENPNIDISDIMNSSEIKKNFIQMTEDERTEIWQERMREIQGAIIIASIVELMLGLTGIVGFIVRYITPMTVAPAITLIGLSLFKVATLHSEKNWAIAFPTIILIILFSQYMRKVEIPIPFAKKQNDKRQTYPIFQVFPVLLAIMIMWIVCIILTASNVLKEGDEGRTDSKWIIFEKAAWFRVPYPFQWGTPTISAGAVIGMIAAIIASTIESIGDYYAAARISGAKAPPTHAINRGIFIEGLGCVLAGIFGTGNGSTSYSENIGALSVTKVGSRRVIQSAGVIMVLFALIGKIGALLITIPEPIVGGIFFIVFGTVAAVGLSNLQGVNLNSPRNIFIIGFSVFFSLSISEWVKNDSIDVGNENINQIIYVMLKTGMFIAGVLGFFFDNTIPGTKEERGLIEWSKHLQVDEDGNSDKERDITYDLPVGMNLIRRSKLLTMLPISPTFQNNKKGKSSSGNQSNHV